TDIPQHGHHFKGKSHARLGDNRFIVLRSSTQIMVENWNKSFQDFARIYQ
ncbi:hypothetical protein KI387_039248, partial [Taxus chinensis]